MEQRGDHLDKLIRESFDDIEMLEHNSEEYKDQLIKKLHRTGSINVTTQQASATASFRTAAFSLIAAGLLLGFIYTTGMQASLLHLEYKIKADYAMIKSNIDIQKLFIGE